MKFFAFFMLILPLLAYPQAKDDKLVCNPPNPAWSISETAKWAEDMDDLGKLAMREGELTKFGNPIDPSCKKGLTDEEYKKRVARMEAGMAYAMTQSQRCWSQLGIAPAKDIIPILRRTNFNCNQNPDVAAQAMSGNSGYSPQCDHKYEMVDWGATMDTKPIDDVGAYLFHEALHWTKSNNRDYHNGINKSRQALGCNKSTFEDRVYMFHAACFPNSDWGKLFYDSTNGAYKCPGVCENALTQVDEGKLAKDKNMKVQGSFSGHYYKPQEAKNLCKKIQEAPANYAASRRELKELEETKTVRLTFALKKFGNDEDGMHLWMIYREGFYLAENAYDPNVSLPAIQKGMKEKKQKFIAEVKKTCEKPVKSEKLKNFCMDYTAEKNPMVEEIDRLQLRVDSVNTSHFKLYTHAPPADPVVPKSKP